MPTPNRPLAPDEIRILGDRGCQAENWQAVRVHPDFTPGASFHHVTFSGTVVLGHATHVAFARLHNVTLGDRCRLEHTDISDAWIGNGTVIERTTTITRTSLTPFANNGPANVLAEDGARSVPLWRELSAPIAHLACQGKNHPAGDAIARLVAADAATLAYPESRIGDNCRIVHCGRLDSVLVGDNVVIDSTGPLTNCSIEGGVSPAAIGAGVTAENCIFQAASTTRNGCRLIDCLVGEGVCLNHNFHAESSLFFANADFALGEALGAIAGPYAVSHHRSTLVLACQCSFNNFGSGSNSSNHHFKLGPRHGGLLRRGVRCGSGSYLFWPSDIGAYSTVIGRHTSHLDTSIFPFSLVVNKDNGAVSTLVPGVTLFSIGLLRDELKWPARDRRHGIARPRDQVNCAILSPYIMQAIDKGSALLRRSEEIAQGDLRHGGAVIPERRIHPALKIYETAGLFYQGECLLRNLHAAATQSGRAATRSDFLRLIERHIAADVDVSAGPWRDWCGMLLSGYDADEFLRELADGKCATPAELQARLQSIHAAYPRREAIWVARRWWMEHGILGDNVVQGFLDQWRASVDYRFECQVRDLAKEFTTEMMYGFGQEFPKGESFRRVRGEARSNEFMHLAQKSRETLFAMAELPA